MLLRSQDEKGIQDEALCKTFQRSQTSWNEQERSLETKTRAISIALQGHEQDC